MIILGGQPMQPDPDRRIRLDNPAMLVAFMFGAGLAPRAPGTFGTLAAIPVYLALSGMTSTGYLVITALVSLLGVVAADKAARQLGVHDHPGIVIDEVAGYLVTMAFVPFSWSAVAAGFVLFRVFDILKPWPIRWLDRRVEGGVGIVLDDLVAGVLAGVCLLAMSAVGVQLP